MLWIQNRLEFIEGKEDQDKLHEIEKDLDEASDLFESLHDDLEHKFAELEFYNALEEQVKENQNENKNEAKKQDNSQENKEKEENQELKEDEFIKELKEMVKKDIIKIAGKEHHLMKIKSAVDKLKALVK